MAAMAATSMAAMSMAAMGRDHKTSSDDGPGLRALGKNNLGRPIELAADWLTS